MDVQAFVALLLWLMCMAGIKPPGSTQPQPALNFCANNYLGLSNHPEVAEAAIQAIRTHGYGLSSVRFICGTQVCPLPACILWALQSTGPLSLLHPHGASIHLHQAWAGAGLHNRY
jgi:hypothetical protein